MEEKERERSWCRVKICASDFSNHGQVVLNRSTLESEKRFCNNETEVIPGKCVTISDEDLK